jgi:hypothetical protein
VTKPWQGIAQSKGMTFLQRLPEAIPEGQFLVHNSVRPTHPLGSHGFRAWLQVQDEHLEPCAAYALHCSYGTTLMLLQ